MIMKEWFKVLVVNDELFQLTAITKSLETKSDLQIVQAMNGDQAVKLIQKNMVEFHEYKCG